MSNFSIFNWKYGLTKVDVTPGYTATDGIWVPESTVETTISGHIAELTEKELSYIDPVIVKTGARKITTEHLVGLVVGDRIKVTEASGEITTWTIQSKQHGSNLMNKYIKSSRDTYLLQRKI